MTSDKLLTPNEYAFEKFAERHSFYGHDKIIARRVWYALSDERGYFPNATFNELFPSLNPQKE